MRVLVQNPHVHPVRRAASVVRVFSGGPHTAHVQRPLFDVIPDAPDLGPWFAPLATYLPTASGQVCLPGAATNTVVLPVLEPVAVWLPRVSHAQAFLPMERSYSFLPGSEGWVVYLNEATGDPSATGFHTPLVVLNLDKGSTVVLNGPTGPDSYLPGSPQLTLYLR